MKDTQGSQSHRIFMLAKPIPRPLLREPPFCLPGRRDLSYRRLKDRISNGLRRLFLGSRRRKNDRNLFSNRDLVGGDVVVRDFGMAHRDGAIRSERMLMDFSGWRAIGARGCVIELHEHVKRVTAPRFSCQAMRLLRLTD